jgi:hypothetical protein
MLAEPWSVTPDSDIMSDTSNVEEFRATLVKSLEGATDRAK